MPPSSKVPTAALAALLVIAGSAAAQEVAELQPPTPLFASHDPLSIRITADFKAIFRDRDTTEQHWHPATIWWQSGADSGAMPVQVTTRGHFRLKPGTCSFPMLRVRFPREQRAGTLFDKQGNIKLATHCRSGNRRYEQITHREYLVYRAYNAITDSSFRVRMARTAYVDSVAGDTVQTHSFFIEDNDDLGGRIGMKVFEQPGARFEDVDTAQSAVMSVFLYMIGNTDWSLPYLHNIRVFTWNAHFVPIPYDFDWSGVVNAPYARPDHRLGTRSVTERVWRGPCYPREVIAQAVARIASVKDAIYQLYRSHEGLEPNGVKESLEYYDEFFKDVANERDQNRYLRTNCTR